MFLGSPRIALGTSTDGCPPPSGEPGSGAETPSPSPLGTPLSFSEIFPDPEGVDTEGEFIELLRPEGGASPEGWRITDTKGRSFVFEGAVSAGFIALSYSVTGIPLVNGGGSLSLFAPDGTFVETVTYPSAPVGKSFAKTDEDAWQWTAESTPGLPNAFPDPIIEEPENTEDEHPEALEEDDVPNIIAGSISITEFMPDPVGSDDLEWIELFNDSEGSITLSGWRIDDAEGGSPPHTFTSADMLAPGVTIFPRAVTKLALNNTEDDVRLIDPNGTIVESIHYADVREGSSYARSGDVWAWSDAPTPGEPNPIPEDGESEEIVAEGSSDENGELEELKDSEEIMDIASLDGLENGDEVTIVGTVTFQPGDVGKTMVGIQDETGAAIARLYGSVPDGIERGVRIQVKGKVARTNDVVRLNVRTADIQMLGEHDIAPFPTSVAELDRDHEGAYVSLEGTITDVRKTWFMLTDDGARTEVRVSFDDAWPSDLIVPGGSAVVTGTVKFTGNAATIVPATRGDIIIENASLTDTGGLDEWSGDAGNDRDNVIVTPDVAQESMGPTIGIVGATIAGATTLAISRRRKERDTESDEN